MFIGEKKIKNVDRTEETTAGGVPIVKVEYADDSIEFFSERMYEKIASKHSCSLSELRDNRIQPIVEEVLSLLRDWGVKVGELSYFSSMLNRSLDYNTNQATAELWSQWMPKPLSLDDVDLVSIDRVLKSKKIKLEDVLRDQPKSQ
jgi:hypothetical protein